MLPFVADDNSVDETIAFTLSPPLVLSYLCSLKGMLLPANEISDKSVNP